MASHKKLSSRTKIPKTAVLILIIKVSFLINCAKEGMPPGGLLDTVPPKTVSVSPKPDSTGVDPNSKIEITFSERMSEEPTEEAIFISPLSQTSLDYNWQGRMLILSLSEPLQKDKTYVVTIGTNAQDMRKNRMSQSYTFAFSTGKSLDYGTISGEVWVRQKSGLGKETGISIWAYQLSAGRIEISPEKEKPDYATQADDEGKYTLKNLGLGKYRLFAVKDSDRDMLWNRENESIGMTTGDVELTEQNTIKTFVDFILDKIDKIPPGLLNCNALNQNSVRMEFNEELDERTALDTSNYGILSVSDQKPLPVISAFYPDTDTKTIYLVINRMQPNITYELKVLGLKDITGNPIDTANNTCRFDGSEIPDTATLQVQSISPSDKSAHVPLDTKIKLSFNQPSEPRMVETNFSLADSNGTVIVGKGEWNNPNTFVFSPDSLLSGKMRFTINLLSKGIRNLLGNTSMSDSMVTTSFVTINPDTFGTVSGRVVKSDATNPSGSLILALWEPKENGWSYQISLSAPDNFLFERILPGKYFLSGYMDSKRDRAFNLGQPEPFSPMEPFVVYPDTVYVRSRWETEGIELRFH